MNNDISKQFYNYLWAYILVALSGCLGNVVDGIIVGNLISEDGVSAINLSKPVNQLIFTLHLLINAGAGMLVGYAIGQGDFVRARALFTSALTFSTGIGVVLAIMGGILLPDETTHLLCSNQQILPLVRDYLQVLLLGNPAFILMWGLSTMVGVNGQPKLVSIAVIIDNAVNLLLDIVFIKYLDWGIAGSSIATIVGHLVGISILSLHWLKPEHRRLKLVWRGSNFHILPIITKIVSQGAPLAIASICLTLLLLFANTIVLSTMGRTGIFAFAVCMNLLQVYNLFISGTCQTLQSLGTIQVGKGDADNLHLVIRKGFCFITIAMIVTCIFVWIDPQFVAILFGATTPEMITETDKALRIFTISFIPFSYIYVLMIVYKLYSQHHMALFISFTLSLAVIPILWIMAQVAPEMLWFSYLVAYLVEIMLIAMLHKITRSKFSLMTKSSL